MGYSFTLPVRSSRARMEMLHFLKKKMRPWSEIQPVDGPVQVHPDFDYTRYLFKEGELAYDSGKCRIGVNYSVGGEPFDYIYAVFRWAALQVGRKRHFRRLGKSVPYTVYDGHEVWPILLKSEWERTCPEQDRWCLVDDLGLCPISRPWTKWKDDPEVREFIRRADSHYRAKEQVIFDEIHRMDSLWRRR